jgi:acetylornithine deacetylase
MDNIEKKILEEVDQLEDDIIELACDLVSQPSVLGKETPVLEMMDEKLKSLSFDTVKVPIVPGELSKKPGFAPVPWGYENRYNLVATCPSSDPNGRSALFNGHLDVVSPEPVHQWAHPPFDPVIKEGWLYGRGAGDMKAGVAAMIYAVHAVRKAGFGFKGPVTIESVIEEECSGNGTLACFYAGYDAQAVLIPEPFGPVILTHQVGVLWFKIMIQGVSTHVREASSGVNAVEKCYPLIRALRELEAEMNREAPPAYQTIDHPLNLNIGIIHGGDWPSTVPARAEFHGRLSYFPGKTFEEIKQKIIQAIDTASQNDPWLSKNSPLVEFYGFRSDGHSLSRNLPAFNVLNDCHRDLTGKEADGYIATCTTDLRVFNLFGKGQATCFGPVSRNIHGADESVNLESVIHVAKVYALFLSRWCGLSASPPDL